jgi:uncharacterized protein YigE (DUF2233 family)
MTQRFLGLMIMVSLSVTGCGSSAQQPCQFQASSPKPLAKQSGYYQQVQFTYRRASEYGLNEVKFTVDGVVWSPGQLQATLVDQPKSETVTYQTIPEVGRSNQAVLAFNGGYYDEAFRPLGLYKLKQEERGQMSPSALLSGVLGITPQGEIDLVTRDRYRPGSYVEAFQSGPFVIDPGGQMGIRNDDGQQAKRTVVGITANQQRLVVTTSPVSLYALATCLESHPQALGVSAIDRALNLDGGPSTGLYVELQKRHLSMPESAPVRTQLILHPTQP